jgi:hypothetical protein
MEHFFKTICRPEFAPFALLILGFAVVALMVDIFID